MTANSNNAVDELKVDKTEALRNQETVKREIYPEINDKYKGLVIWLGLCFVVIVVIMQQFSGYL
jgi:hypothetical protein